MQKYLKPNLCGPKPSVSSFYAEPHLHMRRTLFLLHACSNVSSELHLESHPWPLGCQGLRRVLLNSGGRATYWAVGSACILLPRVTAANVWVNVKCQVLWHHSWKNLKFTGSVMSLSEVLPGRQAMTHPGSRQSFLWGPVKATCPAGFFGGDLPISFLLLLVFSLGSERGLWHHPGFFFFFFSHACISGWNCLKVHSVEQGLLLTLPCFKPW